MPDSTPVKNGLVPAGAQMMSAWLVNDGCDFMKFEELKLNKSVMEDPVPTHSKTLLNKEALSWPKPKE